MLVNHSISLVIPCLNEEEGLRVTLESLPSFIDEVIVVDNMSTDDTAKVAHSFNAKLITEHKVGYGHALRTGIRHASGEIILTADGDGTAPLPLYEDAIHLLVDVGLSFIWLHRINSKPYSSTYVKHWLRHIGCMFLSAIFSLIAARRVMDSQSGLWIFHHSVKGIIHSCNTGGMAFTQEVKIKVLRNSSLKVREIPIPFDPSIRLGNSKLSMIKDGFRNLVHLFCIALNNNSKNNIG
jgi:glycosyltransferase involved in cell wall biosynthesis